MTNVKTRTPKAKPALQAEPVETAMLQIELAVQHESRREVPAGFAKLWKFLSDEEQEEICEIVWRSVARRLDWRLCEIANGNEDSQPEPMVNGRIYPDIFEAILQRRVSS